MRRHRSSKRVAMQPSSLRDPACRSSSALASTPPTKLVRWPKSVPAASSWGPLSFAPLLQPKAPIRRRLWDDWWASCGAHRRLRLRERPECPLICGLRSDLGHDLARHPLSAGHRRAGAERGLSLLAGWGASGPRRSCARALIALRLGGSWPLADVWALHVHYWIHARLLRRDAHHLGPGGGRVLAYTTPQLRGRSTRARHPAELPRRPGGCVRRTWRGARVRARARAGVLRPGPGGGSWTRARCRPLFDGRHRPGVGARAPWRRCVAQAGLGHGLRRARLPLARPGSWTAARVLVDSRVPGLTRLPGRVRIGGGVCCVPHVARNDRVRPRRLRRSARPRRGARRLGAFRGLSAQLVDGAGPRLRDLGAALDVQARGLRRRHVLFASRVLKKARCRKKQPCPRGSADSGGAKTPHEEGVLRTGLARLTRAEKHAGC